MFEFSCHTWAFTDLTLPEALGTIARMGFRYVDLGSGSALNISRAAEHPKQTAAEIREDLHVFNLKLSDFYLLLPRISLQDADLREKDLALFKALMPFAVALGTPGITLSPGLFQADEGAQVRTIDALQQMLALAQAANIALSIEPHLDSMAATPEQALALVKAVPGLQITLDWAQMACQGVRPEALQPLLPHVRHVQVRQAAKNHLQTPFARGTIDLQQVLTLLHQAGYDGVICVEYMMAQNWHGMILVDNLAEASHLRDVLREMRDALPTR